MEAGVAPPSGATELVSLSFELLPSEREQVRMFAEARGISESQALRQAILEMAWFRDQLAQGKKVLLQNPDGTLGIVGLT